MDRKEINALFKEIAEYKLMEAEAKAHREAAEAKVKEIMESEGIDTILGDEHKATWKMINGTTFDKKGIIGRLADLTKTDAEAIKKMYTLPNPSMRFTFA